MITKAELQKQIEGYYGEPPVGSVRDILCKMPGEVRIYWGCIPEEVLNDTFE